MNSFQLVKLYSKLACPHPPLPPFSVFTFISKVNQRELSGGIPLAGVTET